MFGWFKKTPVPPVPPRMSIFSTDVPLHPRRKPDEVTLWDYLQNSIKDRPLVPVSSNGASVAMDEKMKVAMDNNIQQAKAAWAGVGFGMNELQLQWFTSQSFVGYQLCAILAQHWLIDKACTKAAEAAAENWYELAVNDGEEVDPKVFSHIRKRDKKFRLKKNLIQAKRFSNIFGIRVCMFVVDLPNKVEFYENPFNIDAVKPGSYKGISQIDPYWIYPELDLGAASDPSAINFYEPTWYRIGNLRVHVSHLIILKTGEVADILKPTYYYGGVPLPQRIAERVYASELIANEAPRLAMTKRVTTMNIDLAQGISNQSSLDSRVQAMAEMRNNYAINLLGIDEKVSQFDVSLAELDAVIMTEFQLVAAIAGIPSTELMETSPKGFNATGEFEMKSYGKVQKGIQENDYTPILERHYELLMKSEITPKFGVTCEIVPMWNPVDSPSAMEAADINLKKAQTAGLLVNAGAVDGEDVRAALITDKDSGFNGLSDSAPETPQDDDIDEGDKTEKEG